MTRRDELVPRPDLPYLMYLAEEGLFRFDLVEPALHAPQNISCTCSWHGLAR